MTTKNSKVVELEQVVIRFAGDSGDGMQLTGSLFSDSTAFAGNDFATFPDYPAEIRAPQGTVSGVSGFQIHFGQKTVYTSGDQADVLVAMNPASLKANMRWVKKVPSLLLILMLLWTRASKRPAIKPTQLRMAASTTINSSKHPSAL